MVSTILMVVAGIVVLGWLAFLVSSQRHSIRDRDRLHAFYAAESGVEQVIDYFNHWSNFTGAVPDNYTTQGLHPVHYVLPHPVAPEWYGVFEPYILSYAMTPNGEPEYEDGELVITRSTFFQNLNAGNAQAVSLTSKIPSCTLDLRENGRLVFRNHSGRETARVTRIELIHPADILAQGGSLPANMRVVTKVVATGRTPLGVEQRVESLITENPAFNIRSPGAILTLASTVFNGNYNVHWGEIWARQNVLLPANFLQKIPRYDPLVTYSSNRNIDSWFRLRTEGLIKNNQNSEFADGRESSGFALEPTPSGTPIYEVPYHPLYVYRRQSGASDFDGLQNLIQRQTLDFPNYDYYEWKTFVQSYGFRYFFTDVNGNVYGMDRNPSSQTFGQMVGRGFDAWFNISPDSPDYYNMEDMVVFIDSVPTDDNGNPGPSTGGIPVINSTYYPRGPDDPAYRKATLSVAGQSTHMRGAMLVAADLDLTGQGNPPRWQDVPDVLMPNGEPPTGENFRIFHNGFLFSWGAVRGGGNRTFYGSVYAVEGYGAGGDPQVYYNYRMKDGSWLNLNVSRVNRVMWSMSPRP